MLFLHVIHKQVYRIGLFIHDGRLIVNSVRDSMFYRCCRPMQF